MRTPGNVDGHRRPSPSARASTEAPHNLGSAAAACSRSPAGARADANPDGEADRSSPAAAPARTDADSDDRAASPSGQGQEEVDQPSVCDAASAARRSSALFMRTADCVRRAMNKRLCGVIVGAANSSMSA